MKNKIVHDERVVNQIRTIQSEAYIILTVILFLSVFIQQIFWNAPFKQYAVEFFCVIGITIYTTIKSLISGINLEGSHGKTNALIIIFGVGIFVTTLQGTKNFITYSDLYQNDGIQYFLAVLVILFISSSLFTGILILILNYLNKKRQKHIENYFDEEESKDF